MKNSDYKMNLIDNIIDKKRSKIFDDIIAILEESYKALMESPIQAFTGRISRTENHPFPEAGKSSLESIFSRVDDKDFALNIH